MLLTCEIHNSDSDSWDLPVGPSLTYVLTLYSSSSLTRATPHGSTIKAGTSTAAHSFGICPRGGPWWLLQQCVRGISTHGTFSTDRMNTLYTYSVVYPLDT